MLSDWASGSGISNWISKKKEEQRQAKVKKNS